MMCHRSSTQEAAAANQKESIMISQRFSNEEDHEEQTG